MPDIPAQLLPEVLTLDPEWLHGTAGYLTPLWLLGPDLMPERAIMSPLVSYFIDAVRRAAPDGHQIGTLGGRIIDDAVDAGHWHIDHGDAVRYVATIDHAGRDVGHEFADAPLLGMAPPVTVPSGRIAMFTTARHRRPTVSAGRRVFLTAATYPVGVTPFSDCAPLHDLTATR